VEVESRRRIDFLTLPSLEGQNAVYDTKVAQHEQNHAKCQAREKVSVEWEPWGSDQKKTREGTL